MANAKDATGKAERLKLDRVRENKQMQGHAVMTTQSASLPAKLRCLKGTGLLCSNIGECCRLYLYFGISNQGPAAHLNALFILRFNRVLLLLIR